MSDIGSSITSNSNSTSHSYSNQQQPSTPSHESEKSTEKHNARIQDVYLLGLGMVLGGACVNWNLGNRIILYLDLCLS